MSLEAVSTEDRSKILEILDRVTLRNKQMYVIIRTETLGNLSSLLQGKDAKIYTLSAQEVAVLVVGSLEYIQEILREMKRMLQWSK